MKLLKMTLVFLAACLHLSADIGVIKNPKPNMVEPKYVELVRVGEMCESLEDDEFIFDPFSLAPYKGGLFVYDKAQAKIFRLDQHSKIEKSYGRVGQGPGEFSGKRRPVFISFGRDGNLYANDMMAWKILSFNDRLEHLGQFRYHFINTAYRGGPAVDADGTAYLLKFEKNRLWVRDQKGDPLFDFPVSADELSTLFYKKDKTRLPGHARTHAITPAGILLVYLKDSSTLFTFKNKKLIKKATIWPRDALTDYKSKLKRVIGIDTPTRRLGKGFINLFPRTMIDYDEENVFYLDYVNNETRQIRALYKFTVDGKLLKVLHIKFQRPTIRLVAKGNRRFYGIDDEKIVIYKEKEE